LNELDRQYQITQFAGITSQAASYPVTNIGLPDFTGDPDRLFPGN